MARFKLTFNPKTRAKGELLFVVYTRRGDTIRLISARKAGTNEREKYYSKIKTTNDKTDWNKIATLTDAEILRAAEDDEDTFIPDDNWFEAAEIAMPKNKEVVTLRLDHEILDWFKKGGIGYQTRINAVLKTFVKAQMLHKSRLSTPIGKKTKIKAVEKPVIKEITDLDGFVVGWSVEHSSLGVNRKCFDKKYQANRLLNKIINNELL